jgi:hypothetical protein
MKIHIVTAQIGEYSDTRWWIVGAHRTEHEAEHEAARLNGWVAGQNAADAKHDRLDRWNDEQELPDGTWGIRAHPPGDPEFEDKAQPRHATGDPTTLRYGVESVRVDWGAAQAEYLPRGKPPTRPEPDELKRVDGP